jgi:hypothetical protein
MRKLQLLLATAVLTAVGFASVAVHAAPAAQALCAGPIKPGTWTSVKPEIHWITKIHLTFNCDDTVYVGCSNDSDCQQQQSSAEPPWSVRVWGCYPDDCYWGKVVGKETPTGALRARFDGVSVTRHLRIWRSPGKPNQLEVKVRSVFKQPGVPDQVWYGYFKYSS